MRVTVVQIKAFLAVADEGGFSAAAAEAGTTQAALSYSVAALERSLGGPVLERQPSLTMTDLGRAILPFARSAVAAIEQLELAVDLHFGRSVGTVRLAASTTACASIVPRLLEHWRRALPGVDVQVMEGEDDEMPLWLSDRVVDAAILIDPAHTDQRSKIVARDVFEAVVRRDHPLVDMEAIPVAALLEDPVLVSDTGCRAQVLEICRRADPDFSPVRDVRELRTVMAMVAQGVGVSIIPGLGRALVPDDLVLVPLDPPVMRTLVLTGPTEHDWSPETAALIAETPAAAELMN